MYPAVPSPLVDLPMVVAFFLFVLTSPTAVRRIPGSGLWAIVYLSTRRAIFVRAAVFGTFPRATHSRRLQVQFLVAAFLLDFA